MILDLFLSLTLGTIFSTGIVFITFHMFTFHMFTFQTADIALAPMYATSQRNQAVDFTDPYMAVYATILVRRSLVSKHPVAIRTAADLLVQSNVRYGMLNRGVMARSFKRSNDSLYQNIWERMLKFRPTVFTRTNEEGIERLRKENDYAFILPHTIGDYVATRQPCDIIALDKFLMHTGYVMAVRKENSTLKIRINSALSILTETGFMDKLYRKWWLNRNECIDNQNFLSHQHHNTANTGRIILSPQDAASGKSSHVDFIR